MTTASLRKPAVTSEDAPRRAVIYCRISKDSAKLGLGVERQEKACRALAAKQGWHVVSVLVENDVSASRGKKRRPLYRELLRMIESGEVDVVISWAQDRLLRQPLELEELITLADICPFTIAAPMDAWTDLTTASGREMARFYVARARGEIERKTERQKAAYRQSAESGKPHGRAYGYERDGTIIPEEAAIVRDLFARYVAGQGINGLVTWINAQGITNTKGATWGRYGMTWMLRNPKYIAERHRIVNKDGRNRWEYVGPGNWQPIIDRDTFMAAQGRIADNANRNNRTAPNKKWLGAGLYVCGMCGRKMLTHYAQWVTTDGVHHPGRRYVCMPSRHLLRKADEIDELVQSEMVSYLRANDLAALLRDDRDVSAARALREEAIGLQGSLAELATAIANGELSPALAGQAERKINERIAEIDAETAVNGERSALALVAGADDPGQAWRVLAENDIASAQAVAAAICTITLRPGKRGRGPFDPASVEITWPG